MADIIVYVPEFKAASIAPNPVIFNSAITVTITVEDIAVVLSPEWFFSGEIYSGEDVD